MNKNEVVHEQANQVVIKYETAILEMMTRELLDAEHRAENCHCPACLKHVEGMKNLLGKELERTDPQK